MKYGAIASLKHYANQYKTMGLCKSRKPYPRVVLLVESTAAGEIEIAGRSYKKAYKATTYSGLLQRQEHLWKYLCNGSCFPESDLKIRASAKDGTMLVIDAGDYERLLGRTLVERERLSDGTFASKSSQPREVKSLRVTDETWTELGDLANLQGVTRADLVEQWVAQFKELEAQKKSVLDENEELKHQVAVLAEQLATVQLTLAQTQEKLSQMESAQEKVTDPLDRIYDKWYGNGQKKRR